MLIARVVSVPAENSGRIYDIGQSGGHRVLKASDHRLVSGWIAGFFVGLPPANIPSHWRDNSPRLIHSELRQDRRNVAVLTDVNRGMLPIALNILAEIEGDTPELIHLEHHFDLILDLHNQALVRNDEETIDIQNNRGNDSFIHIMVHAQFPVDT
jgi:hypothetical protein